MVEVFEGWLRDEAGSSKGNQLKWYDGTDWYKADYAGYEGLAEYVSSKILARYTNLGSDEITEYETVQIKYKSQVFNGCVSRNMLPEGWHLITLERLIKQATGRSIGADLYRLASVEDRLKYLEHSAVTATGLSDFGLYLSKIITMDAMFLNEDRHTHNIAVLFSPDGKYHLCPFFDFGAALLSDTTLDYPLNDNVYELIKTVKAKTVCTDFDEALEASEHLYGSHLKFKYDYNKLVSLLNEETYYSQAVKSRVLSVLMEQRRKYIYLFE